MVLIFQATSSARRRDAFFGGHLLPHSDLSIFFIFIPCFLLALIFHPNLNAHAVADISWTVACYVETFALIPQLVVFQRSGRGGGGGTARLSAYVSNWVFALGIARLLHFGFWYVAVCVDDELETFCSFSRPSTDELHIHRLFSYQVVLPSRIERP